MIFIVSVQGAIDSIVSVRRNNRKHNLDVSVFSYGMLQIFRISAVGQLQARLNLRGFHRLMKKEVYYIPIALLLHRVGERGKRACSPLKSRIKMNAF
jgi:hypothetical protein